MNLRNADFLRRPSAPRLGWVVLAVGMVAVVIAIGADQRGQARREALEQARLQRIEAERVRQRPAPVKPPTAADRRAAQAEHELRRPWLAAMRGVEAATVAPVFLVAMSIERGGLVKLEAEAPAFDEVLAYVDRLGRNDSLGGVTLVSHQQGTDPATGGSLVRFAVSAEWGPR
jgi:hypothetical protein